MPRRPARGVAYSASIRTRYPLAPCIPFISERRRGCPRSQVFPRPGTGRAIGLPALRATVGTIERGSLFACRVATASVTPLRERYGGLRRPGGPQSNRQFSPVVLTCKYAVKGVNTGDCGGAVGFIPVLKHGAFSSTSRNLHRLRREIRRGRYLRIRQVRGSVATSGERV